MYVKVLKSERGFTLVELMIGMVLFTLLLGLSSRALATGLGLSSKQSNQLDLRMTSRQILTQMEKNIQSAASINLKTTQQNSELVQDIELTIKNPNGTTKTETYEYIPSQKKIILFQGTNRTNYKIVASNLNSADFFDGAAPTTVESFPGVPTVKIAVNMKKGSESLDIRTNASPRWNVGDGVPAIISIDPRNLTDNLVQYTLTTILGTNTHFTADSVVKFKQGNDVIASSSGQLTAPGNNSTTLNAVTLTTTNSKPLPWGFYDLYIETPDGTGGTEIVWASSVITCQWDSRLWIPTIGANNSGGWDARTFPVVEKTTEDNNDKYCAYTFREMTDFDVKATITITGGGNTKDLHATPTPNPGTGNTGGTVPDAEIVLWATSEHNNKNIDQHFARYLGFGIDSDSAYIRTVGWPQFPGPKTAIKLPNALDNNPGQALVRVTASNGILHFFLNGVNIDSQIDAACNGNSIRDYSNMNPPPQGYPGTIANGGISAKFSFTRL
jgi:prepilin-type N-terminal cleavage/methylation domain-containing protein